MASWAIAFGVINIVMDFFGFTSLGWAATGFLFGTFGLLFAAASLPKDEDDAQGLAPNVKLGIVLPSAGVILSIVIGLLV